MPPNNALVRQISTNSSSAIDVLVRHSFNTRTDGQSLFELLKSENDENNWSGKYLKEQFNNKDLNQLFSKYRYRIRQSSFSIGLIIIILFCIVRITTTLVYTEVLDTVISLCLYAAICLVCSGLLSLVLTEAIIWNRFYSPSLVSTVLLFMLELADYSHVLVDIRGSHGVRLSPTYILLVLNYFFLPFPRMSVSATVGCSLSLVDLLFSGLVFYADQNEKASKYRAYHLTADVIFLLTSNVLGLYKTYLDEVHQRRAFLDHRMCIESQIKCDLEKVQEEQLMLSVVPPYILDSIKMDIRDGIQFRHLEPRRAKLFGDFYIKKHSNVSVLFSDIVNFTVLTCTLEVQELVLLLSRLFGRFDEIACKNVCERIKIVGDCYVAASGLPPNQMSSHARNCVEQAIAMLDIIKEVKGELRVNVDMRIGIHSGQVMSGILGVRKWQYDIWSKDVDIANLMEHTGKPGLVHISEATFQLLSRGENHAIDLSSGEDGSVVVAKLDLVAKSRCNSSMNSTKEDPALYDHHTVHTITKSSLNTLTEVEENDAEDEGKGESIRNSTSEFTIPICGGLYECRVGDEQEFDRKAIKTYFVLPPNSENEDHYDCDRQLSKYLSKRRRSSHIPNKIQNSAFRRPSTRTLSSESTASSIEYSPLEISAFKYEKLTKSVNGEMASAISKMALSKKEQWSGCGRINPLFLTFRKPYSEMEYIRQADPLFKYYLLAVGLVFVGLFGIYMLATTSKSSLVFVPYVIVIVPLMLLIYFAWHDFIVNVKKDVRQGGRIHVSPRTRINSLLTMVSRSVSSSFKARIIIWSLAALLLSALVLIDVCLCVFIDDFKCRSNSTHPGVESDDTTNSRFYTYSSALVVTSVASFLHIHFLMKLVFYIVGLLAFYSVVFFARTTVVFESFLPAHYIANQFPIDQAVYITFVAICHHLLDRQIEYLSRLDFIWKRDLRAKQEDSNVMSLVNKFLVQNIVPLHVVDHFLNATKHNEFYHERHEKVAVMFAQIRNFFYIDEENDVMDSELTSLKLLNEVITDMDNLLLKPEFSRVEKIKVIGTTYMAAAGLKPNVRRNSVEAEELEPFDVETNVVTLVNLAMAMMQSLNKFNCQSFQEYELRVGIDCGPSMAGVVGNNKPIYDVWGNAVNVASRMETTGEVGKIQVTEETAEILIRAGYSCQCRGEVFVKGKGMLTTYFVIKPPPTELFVFSQGTRHDYYDREDTQL